MLKVMFGSEPYCIDKAIEGMKKEISFTEMNVSCFEGLPSEAEALCRTVPFMDSRRLIVASVEALTDDVLRYLDIPEFTELVILPGCIDKRREVYKALDKAGCIEAYGKLTENQMRAFVLRHLKTCGGKMTERAFRYFAERTGYLEEEAVNLYAVEVYLRQLLLLGPAITEESIRRIVPPACNEQVFALSKALADGNMERAIWLGREFLERGESSVAILSLLLRPFRLGYKASLYPPGERTGACALIGVPAYQIKGVMRYPEEVLNRAMDVIQEGIAAIKKGGGDSMFLLTLVKLVFTLCPEKGHGAPGQ